MPLDSNGMSTEVEAKNKGGNVILISNLQLMESINWWRSYFLTIFNFQNKAPLMVHNLLGLI